MKEMSNSMHMLSSCSLDVTHVSLTGILRSQRAKALDTDSIAASVNRRSLSESYWCTKCLLNLDCVSLKDAFSKVFT